MSLTYISIFFLLVIQVISQQNYYEILGVPRNANEQLMRKQFKKQSLKYHPDKNKDKESQKIYQQIVNAYEVLKDPETRQIYDQFGEQGLKEGKQQQKRQNFNAQFRQGENGGINYFFQTDVIILNFDNISKFYRRREVWLVFFHKSTRQESQNYKDTIKDIASKYYGIFNTAAIDCIEEEELCDDFSVYEQPLIKVFPSNINLKDIQYTGNKDGNRIAALAIKQMESFSQVITEKNYDDFVSSYQTIPKVFLFTEKKSTSPLFMALSKEFIGRLKFGEIRNTQVNLIQKFQIQQFPTLMVLTDASQYQGIFYDGVLKKDQLMKFLRSNTNKEQVNDQINPSKPIKMTHILAQNDAYCGITDSNFCFLVIHKADQLKDVLITLNDLSKQFINSPIKFYYVEKSIIENGNIFEDEDVYNELPSVYIIKGKRMKYISYKEQFLTSPLVEFIESVLGGGGEQKKMHDFLNRNVFQSLKYDL